jgi:hypothetical protein
VGYECAYYTDIFGKGGAGEDVEECRWVGKEGEHTLGKFEEGKPYEIWYLREGTEVKFHLEVENKEEREGLAAVLMIAVLCNEEHEEPNEQQDTLQAEEEWIYIATAGAMCMLNLMVVYGGTVLYIFKLLLLQNSL